jgi:mRNA-degrading endonuclease RelE of RelBE toxin-antitoxin system
VRWQTNEKDFKKKLKNLERRTNEKVKEFLKGLMDEKEKWALAYDEWQVLWVYDKQYGGDF